MPACSLDKVVTFDDQILFERNYCVAKDSGGIADQIDVIIEGQPEVLSDDQSVGEEFFKRSNKKHHGSKRSCNTFKSIRATRICSSKTCQNTRNVEDNHEVFHPISSEDAKIIREQGILEKHEILQLKDRVQCTFCH